MGREYDAIKNSIAQYINGIMCNEDDVLSMQVKKAKSNELSVAEISKLCGYENSSYFSTLFHEKFGLSPSAYREKTATLI